MPQVRQRGARSVAAKGRGLVSLRPRSRASMEGRAAVTDLGFRTLRTPGCTVFLCIKLPLSLLTGMVFGGPRVMDIIGTRPASLSHAWGRTPSWLRLMEALSSLLCGPLFGKGHPGRPGFENAGGCLPPEGGPATREKSQLKGPPEPAPATFLLVLLKLRTKRWWWPASPAHS